MPDDAPSSIHHMKTTSHWVLACLAIVGFLCGFVAHRVASSGDGPEDPATAQNNKTPAPGTASKHLSTPTATRPAPPPGPPESLEAILAPGAAISYRHLALWLFQATPEDIAAYWQAHTADPKRRRDITDLVMLAWTRVDPQGATAAVAGTKFEEFAWWAWAAHDPKTALDTAMATRPERVGNVAWGIGEFHPAWLRKHFDEIPESARQMALQGLFKWGETGDPLATLEFLKQHGTSPPRRILRHFVARDPLGAYDWFKENKPESPFSDFLPWNSMGLLQNILAETHPEVLEQLAGQLPSGTEKLHLEEVVYKRLLAEDPEAAAEQALATEAQETATDRIATVACQIARTDPRRAFELARELFARNPDAFWERRKIYGPGEILKETASSRDGVQRLLYRLCEIDPTEAVRVATPTPGDSRWPENSALSYVFRTWARNNCDQLEAWTREAPLETRKQAATALAGGFLSNGRFEDAARWVPESNNPKGYAASLVHSWKTANPQQAREWIEQADLPEAVKTEIITNAFPEEE